MIKETMQIHGRIVFKGNNYSAEWIQEAQKRGLLNLPSTMDCLPLYTSEKNIRLFTKHKVLTERELRSRQEILTENYCKCIGIEAMTMTEMAFKDIIPAEGGMFCKNEVIPAMKQLREVCDKLETVTSSQYWPFPSYGDLLFSVN